MSNPIKYSTGTESLALKKGNFYIGTGDVGKGPTSSTGYYNGITPPSGGYTIYLNKETGGPSIYTASNDAQLISLTNSIAGTSYTTVNECLVYFAGQTDKMVLNRNYEGIVTDGLVLNVDAGFTPSYPKSGTTWYDLGGGNNGTLTNGPTFNSDNGGSIVFDGVDDYMVVPNNSSLNLSTNGGTIESFYSIESLPSNNTAVLSKRGDGDQSIPYHLGTPANTTKVRCIVNNGSFFNAFDSNSSLGVGNIAHVVITFTSTSRKIYINSVIDNTQTSNITLSDNSSAIIFSANGNNGAAFWFNNVKNYITRIYNRALTAEEVLQNYNAQKGRFGL
jgi:hypothetical protein